jgi:hypothetical protein
VDAGTPEHQAPTTTEREIEVMRKAGQLKQL